MIKILNINSIASIQDMGRYKYRKFGIDTSGAMDSFALNVGNAILKNDLNTPAIEVILGAITLEFQKKSSFIITGSQCEAFLNDKKIYAYWIYNVKKGDILKFVRTTHGMYSYICISGGFNLQPALSSYSNDSRSGFGGHNNGNNLQKGDILKLNDNNIKLNNLGILSIVYKNIIKIIVSSEYHFLTPVSKHNLINNEWQVSSQSNRMGVRLIHENNLELSQSLEMLSSAVHFGILQLPASGLPIVLTADCQTTGGYPKIASIIKSDLGSFVQLRFGKLFKFELINKENAYKELSEIKSFLYKIQQLAIDKHP